MISNPRQYQILFKLPGAPYVKAFVAITSDDNDYVVGRNTILVSPYTEPTALSVQAWVNTDNPRERRLEVDITGGMDGIDYQVTVPVVTFQGRFVPWMAIVKVRK